jgi:hypothetical protein
VNFNPQQTLRNNHLFFGFTKSSRIVAKFLWALDQRPLAALRSPARVNLGFAKTA